MLLPLLVALVANVGVLGLGVLPLRQSVANARQAALDARANLANAKLADKGAKDARTSKERADLELKKFYAEILPRNYQAAVTVTTFWLERIADESRVLFRNGQYSSKPLAEPSNLVKYTGKATLVGEYADIRRFLYEIETAEQFVIVESVELSQAGSALTNNLLEVQLVVATYYVHDGAARSGAQ